MSRPYRLYKRYTVAELIAQKEAIVNDPANAATAKDRADSPYLYNAKARRKLEDISWAMHQHLTAKAGAGQQEDTNG
jgi:hypothetical protein